jgi:dihydrofolate synthase / folylpolyglutamate synthase
MTYPQTLDYLYKQLPMFHRIGAAAYKADLSNTLALCRLLEHPETKFRSLHIAGTNGKGSTSHFLASVLQENGYRTGLFTSPHLSDFRERIRVNGKMIPKKDVTKFVETHKEAFDLVQPSFFEWTFALAAWYFSREKVDIAVMETGMGGRLDSTNVITPLLSVITNIGLDHTQFLGDTLPKVATEKAGIIKAGIPVVIGESHPETSPVFENRSRELGSPLIFADRQMHLSEKELPIRTASRLNAEYDSKTTGKHYTLSSPLTGAYQLKNMATVLSAIETLQATGFSLKDEFLNKGIRNCVRNTGIKGRWQIIGRKPLTVADIGHNPDGIREILTQIRLTPHQQLHFVLGVVNDKDVRTMLSMLPSDARYYFCKADIPRGLDAAILAEYAREFNLNGNVFASVKEALTEARLTAESDDLIVVGGSAFVVAEVV